MSQNGGQWNDEWENDSSSNIKSSCHPVHLPAALLTTSILGLGKSIHLIVISYASKADYYVLDFNIYPKLKNIEFLKGEDTMKVYEFGNKVMAHKFCPNCGSTLFVLPYREDNDMIVVNVMFSVLFLIFGIADRG